MPSAVNHGAITWGDCFVAGSGESGFITVRPDNPDIVYVGAIGSSPGGGNSLQRYDRKRDQIRLITTWPEGDRGNGAKALKYRFAWTYPIVISPHDPDTLYIGGNFVFKSTDEGQSWQQISPDLTRADPETLEPSGGPVNLDARGSRDLRDRLRLRRIAARGRRALGGIRRRPVSTSPATAARTGPISRPTSCPNER